MLNPRSDQRPPGRGSAGQTPTPRRRRTTAGVAVLLAAVLLGAASPRDSARATPPAAVFEGRAPGGLQVAVDKLVADGQPGVIVATRRGRVVTHVTAGVADKAAGQPMRPEDRVHIGSITKTFVATVILQLVAERRLSLSDSVQKWLPGVISGHGYDPAQITVRELLQQTSGLRDYTSAPGFLTARSLARTWRPGQLVDLALKLGPPLPGWNYTDTNYILLGMLIRRVTGHTPTAEIQRRILDPLNLRNTSFPVTSTIPGPHAHGYIGTLDVTNLINPSAAWTAGAMISTVDDVARFYRAVLTGRLLPPAEQRDLLSTIPVNDVGELFPEHYGLGIYRVRLPCGPAWGHDGGYPGFKTFTYTSPGGERQAVMAFNGYQVFEGAYSPTFRHDLEAATDIAFCGAHA